jgi:hypothetical protein
VGKKMKVERRRDYPDAQTDNGVGIEANTPESNKFNVRGDYKYTRRDCGSGPGETSELTLTLLSFFFRSIHLPSFVFALKRVVGCDGSSASKKVE